jgi:hypothetical protein
MLHTHVMSAKVTLSPTRNVLVASASFSTLSAVFTVPWACSVACITETAAVQHKSSSSEHSHDPRATTDLFIVLHNPKSGEGPCTARWENLIVSKVDILLNQSSVDITRTTQLSIGH